ncbi:aminotransferase class V-fold PLP-dependent enzyme [bacterium]|nr:aminotransferase class V-fold PLP-dependent enzyme [bacterium]
MQQALAPRDQFPILGSKNYLASHSLGAMPSGTREELQRYADLWASQGILAWDGEWWQVIGEFGGRLERILGACAGTIVPCLNVTLGFAAIASCMRYTPERRRIVLCDLEFTTTLPFWLSQEVNGAETVVLPSPDPVLMPVELLEEAIDERTALVVTSYAYFRSGGLQQVERLQRKAREMGALLVVDAYQAAGCVPIDVSASDFDFFVGGCHKWLCGGPGGGFLYVRPQLIEQLQPSLVGWFSLANPFAYEKTRTPELSQGILRFLNGTPNVPALFAARQGLEWVEKVGLAAIREHSWQLTEWLYERLESLGLTLKSPRAKEHRNGMVCVDFAGAREAQAALEKQGVIVDYRPDCGIRVSPHFYNQLSDLEAFMEALTPLV